MCVDKCTLGEANYLTLVVMNVTTDVAILMIPLPLLWKVRIPIQRKLAIGVLLCSGIFIVIASILRCVMSLKDIQGINVSTIWAIRETFVGIVAVNAAAIKPLFSRSHWLKSSSGGRGESQGNNAPGSYDKNYGYPLGDNALVTIGSAKTKDRLHKSRRRNSLGVTTEMADNSSEEHIVKGLDYYSQWRKHEITAGGPSSEATTTNGSDLESGNFGGGGGGGKISGISGGSGGSRDGKRASPTNFLNGITVTTKVEQQRTTVGQV